MHLLALVLLATHRQSSTDPRDYAITTQMKLARPVDLACMNDEFQTTKLLTQDQRTVTVEVTHYPLRQQTFSGVKDWKTQNASMKEWLQPTKTCNWDAQLAKDLLADLKRDGIDPEQWTDKEVVEQVSRWALRRTKSYDKICGWMVDLSGDKPVVAANLRDGFVQEKPEPGWTDEETIQRQVLGKEMYYSRTRGACTSSSTYLATLYRALGIPARIIICIPSADPNDKEQVKSLIQAVKLNSAQQSVELGEGSGGFSNHMFNEVWIGGKWVRVNYDKVGQGILDPNYLGLMTHILTVKDVSELDLPHTWGARIMGKQPEPKLSSENPYMLLKAWDNLGAGVNLPNPPREELKKVTITGLLRPDEMPEYGKANSGEEVFVQIAEWIPTQDYKQLRIFLRHASSDLTLRSEGVPDVRLELTGHNVSNGAGTFQGFFAKFVGAQPVKDRKYKLVLPPAKNGYGFSSPPDLQFSGTF